MAVLPSLMIVSLNKVATACKGAFIVVRVAHAEQCWQIDSATIAAQVLQGTMT